jgi:hypothetical protein
VVDVVVAWWTKETRVSPNKKDIKKKAVHHPCGTLAQRKLGTYSLFEGVVFWNLRCGLVSFGVLIPKISGPFY